VTRGLAKSYQLPSTFPLEFKDVACLFPQCGIPCPEFKIGSGWRGQEG